jgi:hypothetical protein
MDNDQESAWEDIGGRSRGTVVPLTPQIGRSLATVSRPVSFPEIVHALTPCLQLCAPVGMSIDDKDTWYDAAYMALAHLPADVVKAAAIRAMRTVDHPSKIVPAIIRETEVVQSGPVAGFKSAPNFGRGETFSADRRSPEERAKVAQTMGQLVARMKANSPDLDALLGKKADPA